MAVLLMFLALISPAGMSRRTATPSPGGRPSRQQFCEVDAPRAYVDDARGAWCGETLVAKVSLKSDTRNYIALVQLSPTGEAAWSASADAILTRIRQVIDGIAQSVRMNVAVTLRTSDGRALASCRRDLIAVAASCTALSVKARG